MLNKDDKTHNANLNREKNIFCNFCRRYFINLIFIVFIIFIIAFTGCCKETDIAFSKYVIKVEGLNNYSANNVSEFIFPVPQIEGQPLYTNIELQKTPSQDWKPEMVTTEYGKMISIKTNETNLSNINFESDLEFSGSLDERRAKINKIMASPLSPISNSPAGNYTVWIRNTGMKKNEWNYTTYVYIDKNIKPKEDINHTIHISVVFYLNEGKVYGDYGKQHEVYIKEDIPANVTGWIPVTVQIMQ